MRRIGFLAVVVLVLASLPAQAARYASIILEQDTGRVMHAVNPDVRAYPASLTKMMTLYLVFEALESGRLTLDQKLTVSRHAQRQAPSKLGLKRGQTISVKDVIGALVTKSANDAATTIAEALGGTEARFARMMTETAHRLGMTRTRFRNASGLPHRSQVSTVRDMAHLAIALRRDFPKHYHHFSQETFSYNGRSYRNHNRLLTRFDGVDGVKTGYTRAAGYNLAISAERDGRRLIGVVFGGKSAKWRDAHMARLLRQAFKTLAEEPILVARDTPGPTRRRPGAVAARTVRAAPAGNARGNDWAVQIGAFQRFASAHLAATRATRAVPDLLRARVSIDRDEGDADNIYRARLIGLSESRARNACDKLKRKKIDCIVLNGEETDAERNGDGPS